MGKKITQLNASSGAINGTELAFIGNPITGALESITYGQLRAYITLRNAQAPTAAMAAANPATAGHEIGETLAVVLGIVFTQNDGGAQTGVTYKKNGNAISGNTESLLLTANAVFYNALVAYAAGVANPTEFNGQIAAGSVATGNSITYQGYYKYFFGPVASVPTLASTVRSLSASMASGNTFTLNTGNTQKTFVIVIPSGKNLASVIDANAAFQNITADFVGQSFTMKDANNADYSATMYVKTQTVPYGSNHSFNVTIN